MVLGIVYGMDCVIYDGVCPTKDFKIHKNFSCFDTFKDAGSFKVEIFDNILKNS